jgi:hypothetical protein
LISTDGSHRESWGKSISAMRATNMTPKNGMTPAKTSVIGPGPRLVESA